MAVDVVHDTQTVFRRLIDSMARPGKVSSVAKVMPHIDHSLDCYGSTFLVALTVLDSEVGFHVLTKDEDDSTSALISRLTLAKQAAVHEADFIIVPATCTEQDLLETLNQVKNGTLLDPNASATIILECPSFLEGTKWMLTGPGIQTSSLLTFGFSSEVNAARQERNHEYPLGIDLILTEASGKLACIPRTTVMKEVE